MFDLTLLALAGALMGALPIPRVQTDHRLSSAQMTCPADIPLAKAAVQGYISDPHVREADSLEGVDPASLRVLVDATDAATCAHFRSTVRLRPENAPGVRYAYYTAGGYFFVAIMPADPVTGELLPTHAGLLVYDSTRTQKGFYLL